ncbi:MAG: transcriptional regulator, family [Chloroflexi bacterium]|jgi:hypothetical protein|nr:transcriptional regulator, family [Chloroflexota bacterium]
MTNPGLDERTMGERIMRYRVRAGLSRAQLSGLIGRSPSWVYKVERGVLLADRLSDLANLARILKVELADLVGEPVPVALFQPLPPRPVGTGVAPARSGRRCGPARRHPHLPLSVARSVLSRSCGRCRPMSSLPRCATCVAAPAPRRAADRGTGPVECRTRLRIRLLSEG